MDWTKTILKALDVANPLAGMVAEFVAGKLGLGESTVEAVSQAVSGMSGADQVKLKQIGADLQDHLAQYGMQLAIEEAKADTTNVTSARDRDAVIIQKIGHNYRPDVMFVLAVSVVCALTYFIWKDDVLPEYTKGIFTLVLGRFLGYLDNIYNFEFGSTRSNKTKDVTIEQLSKK